MTVQEIKSKAKRVGDTKSYRLILADLNGVPVRVINAILDNTLMPYGYMIENDEIKITKRYLYSGASVKTLEKKEKIPTDKDKILEQIKLEKSTIKGLNDSIAKVNKAYVRDKTLLKQLKQDLSKEEKKLGDLVEAYDGLHSD